MFLQIVQGEVFFFPPINLLSGKTSLPSEYRPCCAYTFHNNHEENCPYSFSKTVREGVWENTSGRSRRWCKEGTKKKKKTCIPERAYTCEEPHTCKSTIGGKAGRGEMSWDALRPRRGRRGSDDLACKTTAANFTKCLEFESVSVCRSLVQTYQKAVWRVPNGRKVLASEKENV